MYSHHLFAELCMVILGGDYVLITSGKREKSHGAHSVSHIQN